MPKAAKSSKSDVPSLTVPNPPLDTPALDDREICYSYEIARGEMGVLSFEPYKSLVLPYWAFRTVPIAQNSAEVLWAIFRSYVERGDFVGADMTRKFIQMGMTRAKRYANHKGGRYVHSSVDIPSVSMHVRLCSRHFLLYGIMIVLLPVLTCCCRKYGSDGKELKKWSGEDADGKRREKQEASDLFKSYWRRCTADEEYVALKEEWQKQKKEYKKG